MYFGKGVESLQNPKQALAWGSAGHAAGSWRLMCCPSVSVL